MKTSQYLSLGAAVMLGLSSALAAEESGIPRREGDRPPQRDGEERRPEAGRDEQASRGRERRDNAESRTRQIESEMMARREREMSGRVEQMERHVRELERALAEERERRPDGPRFEKNEKTYRKELKSPKARQDYVWAPPGRGEMPPFGRGRGMGPGMLPPERHLEIAIQHLHQAGMHDIAEKLQQHLESEFNPPPAQPPRRGMQGFLGPRGEQPGRVPPRMDGPGMPGQPPMLEMLNQLKEHQGDMQEQLEKMKRAIQELNSRMERERR